MNDRVGQQLGNYRLIRLLGEGGFAEVYLGQHVRLELQAAIKVLHTHLSGKAVEQFYQEAQTLAKLVHPAIVRVFDYDVQEGVPFLVMDYAPNGSLRLRYPKGSVVPLAQILSSVQQVATALQYAHDHKVIHRDVKPENMLLGRQQEVLLSDFGLALLAHSTREQSTQNVAGTVAYMAPEQINGKPRPASDQYSLGVVVYEWLCGERPFQGSLTELYAQHLFIPPPPLHEKVPTISAEIEHVVLQALAKDPEQRFPTVQAFVLALQEACKPESSGQTLCVLASERPAEAGRATKHNLPAQLTALLGREQEVGAMCRLLRHPEVRLVTFTGTGGVGKTRLALQVATELLADFPDGVYLVTLAPISDPDLVVPTIAQTLGLKEGASRSMLELLQAFLNEKQLLLVLDNFEQVLGAAPHLTDLLASCPDLKLLVTSRATLHLQGEHEFPVPPLTLPDLTQLPPPDALSGYAAVALFVSRAQAVKPTFHLTATNAHAIAEICVRLDGLPLAIELGAARIKLLSPQVLLTRLEHRLTLLTSGGQDAPVRHQTLRKTLAWSYDLLNAEEQRLFRRLSIFVGGCTLEAIESVCTALDGGAGQVIDDVASLLDKSLLQQTEQEGEEPRVGMLETLREYAWEALDASKEAEAVRQAHALYYLGLAEEAQPTWRSPQGGRSLARLSQEHDNLRAAMSWLFERGETELALRLGGALGWFWHESRSRQEGWHFLERALAGGEDVAIAVRAKALDAAGVLAGELGHFERGAVLCEQSLALFREIGDTQGMGNAVFHLGQIAYFRGDLAVARSLIEECIELSREAGNKRDVTRALNLLGVIALWQGEFVRAGPLLEEAQALFRALGDILGIRESLFWLAVALFWQGDLERAHGLVEEYLALNRQMNLGRLTEALPLAVLGEITFAQGEMTTARQLFEKSCALFREEGNESQVAWMLSLLAKVSAAQGDLAAARALSEESLIRGKGVNSHLSYQDLPLALEGLAAVVAAQGEPTWAARLWGRAEVQRDAYGLPLAPVYRADYDHAVAAARVQLGEQAFATAWAEGRTMTVDQVLFAREAVTIPPPAPATQLAAPPAEKSPSTYPDGLTAREVEVLCLVAQGLTNAQIAEQLVISPRTVNNHLTSIYSKIHVSSRSAATRYAIEHRLV